MNSLPACARCGADRTVVVRGVPDFSGHMTGTWDFARCEPCDAWWALLPPSDTCHAELVPDSYPTHLDPRDLLGVGTGPLDRVRHAVKWTVLRHAWQYNTGPRRPIADLLGSAIARLPSVRRRIGLNNVLMVGGPPGRLLDVGCGNGEYLITMARLGWRGEGLEPDDAAAKVARRHGVNVRTEAIERAVLRDGAFDAATASHCLEHVADPWGMLARLARAVRPGGRIVVAVPNPAGAAAQHFGRWWRAWDPPRHLVLLGPRGLLAAARDAGLVARVTPSHRWDRGTARESLRHRFGRAPGRGMLALTLLSLRLAGGAFGADELVLEAVRP